MPEFLVSFRARLYLPDARDTANADSQALDQLIVMGAEDIEVLDIEEIKTGEEN